MPQLPYYKTGERDMGAPSGFQPQTQANNGGPVGLGQPAKATPQAAGPGAGSANRGQAQGPDAPQPVTPGTGNPLALYGQSAAAQDPRAQLWANRNSTDPVQLIMTAFMQFQGRAPQPLEIESLLRAPNVDALAETLLNLAQPGQQSPVQQAVMGRR